MLALLLGLRVAVCPEPYVLQNQTFGNVYYTFCGNSSDISIYFGEHKMGLDSPAAPSKELLCTPATEQTPCCVSEFQKYGDTQDFSQILCIKGVALLKKHEIPGAWGFMDSPEVVCNETVHKSTYGNDFYSKDDLSYLASVDCTEILHPKSEPLLPGGRRSRQ